MAYDMSKLRKVRGDGPPRILIYGTAGIGKTTLAAEFPNAVFIQTEDGTPADLELNSFGIAQTFGDVMEGLASLYSSDHQFNTLILDSVTELQRLVFTETCARGDDKGNAKKSIEDFGYGKGYVYAQRVMQEFIDGITALRRDKGMAVILIAHSKVERFDDPESVSYDRYEIDLHDKLVGMIERDMDAILLLKNDVSIKTEDQGFNRERARADGGGTVWIHARGKPAFVAKNRFGIPDKVRYTKGQGFTILSQYMIPASAPVAAEVAA
jgi:hypothetical protein